MLFVASLEKIKIATSNDNRYIDGVFGAAPQLFE